MNKKVLIGFCIVMVLFLALPLVMSKTSSAPAPMSPSNPKYSEALNATSLVGTSWSVKTPQIPAPVTITLNPNNQAIATVPGPMAVMARRMVGTDTFVGTWVVEGDHLRASITFRGKTQQVLCKIQGNKLIYDGVEIHRIN